MKDNMTLLAAAAGGFMLSIAIAGIIRAEPVTSWQTRPNLSSTQVTQMQLKPAHPDKKFKNSLGVSELR